MKFPYCWEIDKLGADPEVFLVDKRGNPVSVEGLLGGTKNKPLPMAGLPDGFFVQEDNVAAEYNICPAKTAQDFSRNIMRGLSYVQKQVRRHGYEISCQSALHFSFDQLNTPHAQMLGCEPDFNVWRKELNEPPMPPQTLMTAAGHVHISWKNPNADSAILFGRAFDLFVGVPSLLVTKPNERRQLYGRAGAVRLKNYGVECRILGNEWLLKKAHCTHIFHTCTLIADRLNIYQDFLDDNLEFHGDRIQDTINNHNIDEALKLMAVFDVPAFPE